MEIITERDYILSQTDMTEYDYIHWKKLTHTMTTSARMMGLKDNPMTRQIFHSALSKLMDFEKLHHIQFYELGVSIANAEAYKEPRHKPLSLHQ